MRMNCDRLMGDIYPYEILVRYRDKYGAGDYGAWSNWRLAYAHQTESGRDDAYLKLTESDIKQYKPHLNVNEYKAQCKRRGLDVPDETDIAGALVDPSVSGSFKESTGVDPGDGVVTYRATVTVTSLDGIAVLRAAVATRTVDWWLAPTTCPDDGIECRWIEL